MATPPDTTATAPGMGVDSAGRPVIDPTANVLSLVAASKERHDDLMGALRTLLNTRFEDTLRYFDKVTELNSKHTEDLAGMREKHQKELMEKESQRIDAIRAVDAQAVATANEKATAQAAVLAAQLTASADSQRVLVANSAEAIATQLTGIITPINDRLAVIEKSINEGAGKQGVRDPILDQLISKLDTLQTIQQTNTGRSSGVASGWGLAVGAAASVIAIISIIERLLGR